MVTGLSDCAGIPICNIQGSQYTNSLRIPTLSQLLTRLSYQRGDMYCDRQVSGKGLFRQTLYVGTLLDRRRYGGIERAIPM